MSNDATVSIDGDDHDEEGSLYGFGGGGGGGEDDHEDDLHSHIGFSSVDGSELASKDLSQQQQLSEKEEQQRLASKETKAVSRTKFIFMAIMVAVGAAAGGLTYHFLTQEEDENFAAEVRLLTLGSRRLSIAKREGVGVDPKIDQNDSNRGETHKR